MALFQISEPGQSPKPHQKRLAIGIDLGTTHSLVASVRNDVAEAFPDKNGRVLMPSVIRYLKNGQYEYGYQAISSQNQDPVNTIVSVKRLMGRSYEEAQSLGLPYHLEASDTMVKLKVYDKVVTPVEVSARILEVLRKRAEDTLKDDIVGAVITVPAYFDDTQRQATKDAARLAGINVLRLINEPTAAALAYGLDNQIEGVFVVYDLGGGTFDVSILKLSKGVFEVIATAGDTQLGGDDFDKLVVDDILRHHDKDHLTAQDKRSLLTLARKARERLSTEPRADIKISLSDGLHIDQNYPRSHFENIAQPLVHKTLDIVKQALSDAQLSVKDIDGVVLVGGATRMPIIRDELEKFFGQAPLSNLNPDEVVALGAARQANLLVGNTMADQDWLLLDVTPLSLGLETMGGLVEHIIPRNSTIPVARAQEFTTYKDGQTAMSLHILQGERDTVEACRSLAHFELRGIPPMVAGAARIRVTFQVDADGLLNVEAQELSTGVNAGVTVKPSYGISEEEIANMLRDSIEHSNEDAQIRIHREQQVSAKQLIESVHSALKTDADLLSSEEQAEIERLIQTTMQAVEQGSTEEIRANVSALSQATDGFAAKRMDRSIRQALSGKSVGDL
ncbi:Fe-S protein assembly chaperone HscA [Basilea psittacipulmonis]|uniref:Chaperone protein HscA homolog n=1 Tax=Basilea psittacipulmonis DSM 24701 TaxID=1072685 RepID=A0A077DHS4_9BURK|nr:Fe-S protein assembly chaperone HscA [Basilea psittacipulmonis]AIL32688.1 molecular chaperone HscA [Basilea psittacipulmonis DSM 24701]